LGLAIAPATFGGAAGDLLVGNFSDGAIDAYDVTTGVFAGTLASAGTALVNAGAKQNREGSYFVIRFSKSLPS
jgi:hypothetical protein